MSTSQKIVSATHYENRVSGAWKFHKYNGKYGVIEEELIATATILVQSPLGDGRYIGNIIIRGTGKNELGICFTYEPGEKDVVERGDDLKRVFEDFLRRRHGADFKGWDIGHGIAELVIR